MLTLTLFRHATSNWAGLSLRISTGRSGSAHAYLDLPCIGYYYLSLV